MAKSRLAFRVFLTLALLLALSLSLLAGAAVFTMQRLKQNVSFFTLERSAMALASLAPADPALAQDFCLRAASDSGLRLTIVGPDGSVWGDSRSEPSAMENHLDRQEVREALRGNATASARTSGTLGLPMTYAAAPIWKERAVAAALRLAMDSPDLAALLNPFIAASLGAALALMALGALASARIGSDIARPVLALSSAAAEWSQGRLESRARGIADPEFSALASTMNGMASELELRIRDTEKRKAELDAILSALGEGVIALDDKLIVRLANPRAVELLRDSGFTQADEGSGDAFIGQSILLASGNAELERLAAECAATRRPCREELNVYGDDTRVLMAFAAPLALEGGLCGAVIALSDLSAIKRLERVRKDFVANVSHELRTPITLIKGFAETLENEDNSESERKRFIAIMHRHADRMASIIDDLLTLARLEANAKPRGQVMDELESRPARIVLEQAIASVSLILAAKDAKVELRCPEGYAIVAHEGLLEQLFVNLLANAAKYGPQGGTIELQATEDRDERFLRFSVLDRGPGIPEKDRARVFERFYRVDRARSRELGGTGLGLAIVRHIALAHGGDVALRPREGGGSEFIVRLLRSIP
jgi:two-component system, OmpR family, phosphate regulon sensor histidine kinase PhoR